MRTLYKTIELDRIKKGLTVDEYCKEAGISSLTYYRLKENKPQAKTFAKISNITGMDVEDLLDLPMKYDE